MRASTDELHEQPSTSSMAIGKSLTRANKRVRRIIRRVSQVAGVVPQVKATHNGTSRNGVPNSASTFKQISDLSLMQPGDQVTRIYTHLRSRTPIPGRIDIAIPLSVVCEALQNNISPQLTAYLATVPVTGSGSISDLNTTALPPAVEQRLRTAHAIMQLLLDEESPDVVKSWFAGASRFLGGVSPARCIRNGHLESALDAAYSFLAGAYD